MEDILVTGICSDKSEARLTLWGIPDQPGIAAQVFESVNNKGISVDMIIQSRGQDGLANMSFTVTRADLGDAIKATEEIVDSLSAREFNVDEKIAKISIVGAGMKAGSGIAARMFRTLADKGITQAAARMVPPLTITAPSCKGVFG